MKTSRSDVLTVRTWIGRLAQFFCKLLQLFLCKHWSDAGSEFLPCDGRRVLLFNKKLPSVLDYSKSSFVVDENTSDGEMMMTAMGQGNTLVSPYHMALITQAIANGGT